LLIYFSEIVIPYSCYYVATILVEEVKEAQEVDPKDTKILKDFCNAVDEEFLRPRQELVRAMFEGEACIDLYNELYAETSAEVYDPFTSEQTNEVMCTQLVTEIETLVTQENNNELDALRYSYIVSQNTDL